MLTKDIIDFLTELKENNTKEWFDLNRKRYEILRKAWENWVYALITKVHSIDNALGNIAPKDCVFRIFRDVRFSKDKSPYKTNFGAYICRGGRKSPYAGFYVHLEPGGSFLSGGIYMPEAAVLKAIRNEIFENTDEFKSIIEQANFKQTFGEVWGNKLTTSPKGFPKDFADIDLLKLKDYVCMHYPAESKIFTENYDDYAVGIFQKMKVFNEFLNSIVTKIKI